MGLTGFSLCDPKALSPILHYNVAVRDITRKRWVKKELGA
jgi:hypothetical protein